MEVGNLMIHDPYVSRPGRSASRPLHPQILEPFPSRATSQFCSLDFLQNHFNYLTIANFDSKSRQPFDAPHSSKSSWFELGFGQKWAISHC